MNDRLPRLISGALVVLSGFALWEIIQIKGASLIQQPSLASAAAVCCLIAVFLGITGFLAPHRYWENVLRQWSDLYTNFSQPAQPTHHWLGSVLLSFSMIIYFVVMMKMIPLQPSPENNDQGAFLAQAQAVQTSGGPTVLIRQLVSGTYQEANQHPLYVALLSYFPDYESGKRLSAIFGLSALLLFSMGITRQYGTLVGGLTGFFISVNAAYCQLTGRVVCEGLLLFFLAGLWLIVLRLPDLRSGRLPYLHLMGIGILLGLAWLTKGTALLLILGLGLWFCSYAVNWRQLCARFIRKTTTVDNEVNVKQANTTAVPLKTIFVALTLVIVSFAVIAAPLLVRNTRVYGSPTFNANSYLMFQDEFTEPHALAKQGSLREAAQAYFKTHSVSEIVKREVKGLLWQVFIFLRSLGPLPFEEGRLFFGVLALPFLVIGLIAETHPARRLYLIWMVLFWVAFAWYLPIAAGERFLMPLLLPALAFISLGIVRVGQLFVQRRTA
ncbi:hypothetical protein [Gimesia aquarii]|uniref:Glycosyltransferase RgtA/B/C/D-like domain-containing protein n=1 Tax=Gimesia aquarii TaxID=2527964 RepID=A0A517W2X6_9PLAN|nr:hypothetical protein [Gimesia aquarii]QDT99598.1 hypothetical protein V144x_51100 [Gimesia aquarii]